VNDHLYRGGEPGLEGLKELAGVHVLVDLDLRESGEGTDVEKRQAEQLGMKYINVPFPQLSSPGPDRMKRVLSLITSDDAGTVYVHCRRGKDRTGTVIACYRIQHDGWQNAAALAEANRYGMSRLERSMRSFVLQFKPMDLPGPLAAEK
jgi:protein tyrosine/serine phosphatase